MQLFSSVQLLLFAVFFWLDIAQPEPEPARSRTRTSENSLNHFIWFIVSYRQVVLNKNILQGYKMLILFAKCTFFGIYIFATFHIYFVYWMRKRKGKYFICKYYFMRSLMYNNHMAMTSSKGGNLGYYKVPYCYWINISVIFSYWWKLTDAFYHFRKCNCV